MIGSRYSGETLRIRDFLTRNLVPFTWLDLEDNPEVNRLLQRFGSRVGDAVVMWRDLLLRNPSELAVADVIGLHRHLLQHVVYDLAVVGAGPAGLGGGRLRGVRGLEYRRARTQGAGRPGRKQHAHRELPGLPDGLTGRSWRTTPSSRPTSSERSCPCPRR